MGEEVKLKLIFANDPHSSELAVPMGTTVRDIKKRILLEFWPDSMPTVDTVERLRLFAGGREIGGRDPEDAKSLADSKLSQPEKGMPTPVHVQPVIKTGERPDAEVGAVAKPTMCFCTLL
uniref:UBL3-like ubiquitin domain-containing protein n=1 Tax=Spumella elongata TaxID=89044 RepID=A0A7S3HQ36_9STRA|mmetsp:Transcript_175039/g.561347  ORF Transcript_175039/g.561347 Transcript_175039/m.561347 type:complete len:120 (+) Transcript_175039:268-627(+)